MGMGLPRHLHRPFVSMIEWQRLRRRWRWFARQSHSAPVCDKMRARGRKSESWGREVKLNAVQEGCTWNIVYLNGCGSVGIQKCQMSSILREAYVRNLHLTSRDKLFEIVLLHVRDINFDLNFWQLDFHANVDLVAIRGKSHHIDMVFKGFELDWTLREVSYLNIGSSLTPYTVSLLIWWQRNNRPFTERCRNFKAWNLAGVIDFPNLSDAQELKAMNAMWDINDLSTLRRYLKVSNKKIVDPVIVWIVGHQKGQRVKLFDFDDMPRSAGVPRLENKH